MDQETLRLFSRQLAHWAHRIIAEGRSPFRQVAVDQALLTPSGEIRPPLIFWINRESFMAGGVILFPESQPEATAETGKNCASALGLRHFVTWEAREIVFREFREDALSTHKTLRLEAADPAAFQRMLRQVMDELKVLSITGTLPPEEFSACYLVNLWRSTLSATVDTLAAEYRAEHGATPLSPNQSVSRLARHKGEITLLRLLALTFLDRLSASVQPEKLETAMRFALETLPEELQKALRQGAWERDLPAAAAIRFHHLFRRLAQLDLNRNRQRMAWAVEMLIDAQIDEIGATPAFGRLPANEGPLLLLHPARPSLDNARSIMEVGSPPRLAALALSRVINELPPVRSQTSDLFALTPEAPPTLIQGALHDRAAPARPQRRIFSAHLRRSWPTRRFALDARAPRWAWELIHLLGLADEHAHFELNLPSDWLGMRQVEPLPQLLKEAFTLERLALVTPGQLRMTLRKGCRPEQRTVFEGPFGSRQWPWKSLRTAHDSWFALALLLDAPIFALLESGALAVPPDASWPKELERGIFLFSRSSLGRYLWQVVGGDQPLPAPEKPAERILRQGLPLPGAMVLSRLGRIPWREDQALPSAELLDGEVVRGLGPEAASVPSVSKPRGPARRSRAGQPTTDLITELAQRVFADGIPKFPEHYLYAHYRPPLTRYEFAAPLTGAGEFFGQFTLIDSQGQTFAVEGRETAQALLLAAAIGGHGAQLPTDRQLTASIVAQYLDDLRRLRQALSRQIHLRVANPETAAQLIERLWNEQTLPPWDMVNAFADAAY